MSNNKANNEGKLWYDVIKNEGEIHVMKGNENTVFCSIYSEPLEDEDYAKAKLICDAVNCYQPFFATGSEWKPPKPIIIDDTPKVEQDKDIEQLAEKFISDGFSNNPFDFTNIQFRGQKVKELVVNFYNTYKANTVNKELDTKIKYTEKVSYEVSKANADLITKNANLTEYNKELLEALKGLTKEITQDGYPLHSGMTIIWLDKCKAAIKKAEQLNQ